MRAEAAFLVLAILASVVLSLAVRDIMSGRRRQRNRDAALAKARAAEAALAEQLRRDLEAVRESEYLRTVLALPDQPPVRDIGHLEFSQIMLFRGDGTLLLDETLSNLSDAEARAFVQAGGRRLIASRDGRYLCLGALERFWLRIGGMAALAQRHGDPVPRLSPPGAPLMEPWRRGRAVQPGAAGTVGRLARPQQTEA